ncbi:hypothetical protein J437_LFUL008129 [Ladona fulva]|uniref:Nose resistant-to-fluoxetine protein N-terminal domain-containing protein n=1 Tax=Ladona fulva TaxID=123851 RepID=A0A8K0JYQ6_LADFU|nr:hypothetical protein J437_LFUL008129 [Ladona fulva]
MQPFGNMLGAAVFALGALAVYDASGKVTSGVLRGNVQWLGDDMECFSVASKPSAPEDDPDNIRGQYCAVRIFADPRENAVNETSDLVDIFDMIHTHNALQNSPEDRIVFFPSFSPLTLGLCIPRSCSYIDLEAALTEWISPFNSSDVDLQVLVRPDSCSKERHNQFSTRTYLTIGFCVVMTLMGIAGAIYEIRKERLMRENGGKPMIEGKWTRIFLTFSFRSNLRMLLDTETPIDEIGCLHGIRAFFCIFLYLLHKSFFLDGPKSMVLRSFWVHVDTFVVLSGLLTSYYTMKRLQEGKKLNILKMYVQRYIKFTPLFFVCVLLVGNVVEYLVTDSQYTRLIQLFSRSCRDGWINTVTYTNTFRGFDDMVSRYFLMKRIRSSRTSFLALFHVNCFQFLG